MKAEELAVEGALVFTPTVFPDNRGLFVSPYQEASFVEAHGSPLFPVAQTNHNRSRRGVVRGVHYTAVPPGTAKYVYCAAGEAIDMVIDVRVGSPTFGRWDSVRIDQEECRAVYLPVGVGHAFVALADDTVMAYMLAVPYAPELEKSLSVVDPDLGLPIPDDITPILSERDVAAPGLAEALATGSLPDYELCRSIESSTDARTRAARHVT